MRFETYLSIIATALSALAYFLLGPDWALAAIVLYYLFIAILARRKTNGGEILISGEAARIYRETHSARYTLKGISHLSQIFPRISYRIRIGSRAKEKQSNSPIRKVADILEWGAEKGIDIQYALDKVLADALKDRKKAELVSDRVLGMERLSVIGMSVFFPLFAGTCASILYGSTSGTMVQTMISPLFNLVICMSVWEIATIKRIMEDPEGNILEGAAESSPAAMLALFVTLMAQAYSAYVM